MTAHAMSGDREKSLDAGINDHITKPIDPEKLTETLARWIAAKPAQKPAQQEAAPPEPPPAPAPACGIPDHLPPFDIPAALLRVNGSHKLLRKLILMFLETYVGTAAELRRLIAEGNHEDAKRLAHTLKGVAGTLEARELLDAATIVEHALQEGRLEAMHFLINVLEEALAPAIAAAASLGGANPVAQPATIAPVSDNGELAASLADLRSHIADNNLKARKLFAALSAKLSDCGADAEVGELGNRLARLDFREALAILDDLTAKLGLEQKS